MVVLDTHVLLWWTLDPGKLSSKAVKLCNDVVNKGGKVSAISFWELGIKIKNKKLDIGMSIEEYHGRVCEMNLLDIVPVDEYLWMESVSLTWEHRDPADRVIVATAVRNKSILVSADSIIQKFYEKTVW